MRSLWPTRRPLAARRLPQALVGGDDQRRSGRRSTTSRFPLVAILVLDASAFEVAVLGTVDVPAVHPLHAAGGRLGRPPAAPSDPHRRRLRARALLATVPIAYVADVAHARAALRRRLPRRRSSRSSSTSRTSRTSRRSSIATRSSRGTRSSRSAARPHRSAGRGSAALLVEVFTAPVRRSRRRAQLRRLGAVPPRDPQARGATARSRATIDGRKPSLWIELKEGLRFVLGNPNLRAQAGLHGDLELLLERRVLDLPRVRRAGARPLRRRSSGSSSRSAPPVRSLAALTATRLPRRFGIGPTTIAVARALGAGDAARRLRARRATQRSRSSSPRCSSSASRSSSTTSSRSATGRRSARRGSRVA